MLSPSSSPEAGSDPICIILLLFLLLLRPIIRSSCTDAVFRKMQNCPASTGQNRASSLEKEHHHFTSYPLIEALKFELPSQVAISYCLSDSRAVKQTETALSASAALYHQLFTADSRPVAVAA